MPAAIPIVAAVISSAAAVYAANKSSDASERAAMMQSGSNSEALTFSKQQAENAFQNNEAARRGNYDQWAAQQRRVGSVGELLGMGSREIPGYVPGVDPGYTGSFGQNITTGTSGSDGTNTTESTEGQTTNQGKPYTSGIPNVPTIAALMSSPQVSGGLTATDGASGSSGWSSLLASLPSAFNYGVNGYQPYSYPTKPQLAYVGVKPINSYLA